MATTTIVGKTRALTTNEQAGQAGFTHSFTFGPGSGSDNPLADSVADEDIIFTLFNPPLASVLVKWALILDPAFADASDNAFNSVAVSFGDSNSTTRYLSAVQCAEQGSEVLYTYGNTAYLYVADYTLEVLVESMSAKKLSNIDVGKACIFFQLNQLKALADAS